MGPDRRAHAGSVSLDTRPPGRARLRARVARTMPVSILILTLNEERNLPECLGSVGWARDVVVLDSYSSDRTIDIARERGARVVQRRFDNWAAHQNWAMENIEFANRWVFYIDADERMTPELQAEVERISSDASEQRIAFYVGRKNYFMGRCLR